MDPIKLTIDGKEVATTKGKTVIEAAAEIGIDIPHYCYHQKLSIAGNCRMCLVEVEKMPKLQIACNTQAAEGMSGIDPKPESSGNPQSGDGVSPRQPPTGLSNL